MAQLVVNIPETLIPLSDIPCTYASVVKVVRAPSTCLALICRGVMHPGQQLSKNRHRECKLAGDQGVLTHHLAGQPPPARLAIYPPHLSSFTFVKSPAFLTHLTISRSPRDVILCSSSLAPKPIAGATRTPPSAVHDLRFQPRTDLSSSQSDIPSYFHDLRSAISLPYAISEGLFRACERDPAGL